MNKANQRVLVLVGLPGSGKSTFSTKLADCKTEWDRVNQDDLGSRKACELRARQSLKTGRSIVVDRCNFNPDQRRTWINLARQFDVPAYCLVLTAGNQVCGDRIMQRRNHPTDVSGPRGISILKRFLNDYEPPVYPHGLREGFKDIRTLDPSESEECTVERIDDALAFLYPSDSSAQPTPRC